MNAQGPPQWKLNGNNLGVGSTDFIGTTNSSDLVLKTNNQQRVIIIGTTGGFRIKSLEGTGNALVKTDANGELSRINFPNNYQYVLDGTGNFVTINSLVTGALINSLVNFPLTGWTQNASSVTLNDPNANVGIGGIPDPINKLEVFGNAKIHGGLFVDSIFVTRILPAVGDTEIHIGKESIVINSVVNSISTICKLPTSACPLLIQNQPSLTPVGTPTNHTIVNPYRGKVFIGTTDGGVYGGDIHSMYRVVVKQGLIITGNSGTLAFRGGLPGSPSLNTSGDIAIEFHNQPNGVAGCTNPIKGVDFCRPFPHDAGPSNYDLFISTLAQPNAGNIAPGNVGIGTPYPKYKLSVEGTIGAREVIVETATWCDFVFETDYKLMAYETLRAYIKENKHLPNIPSEEEIIKNGITVSTILKGQTQTIEENVLYILDLEKKYTGLETKYTGLENKFIDLEKKYDELIEELKRK